MQDRVPTYPGRVKLIPVLGQENTYEMVRADEPTQEGTPLNKANLLQDSVAKMYGLSELAVPNDVFDFLGKYNLHWWKTSAISRLTTRWVKRKITEYLVARSLIHLQSNMQIQYLWTIPEWSHSKIRLPQPYSANLAVAMQTKSTKFRLEVL